MSITQSLTTSPLPFGVSAPRLAIGFRQGVCVFQTVSIAFRRFGPPARKPVPQNDRGQARVSIAFRRFGPPAHDATEHDTGRAGVVSIAFRRFGPPAQLQASKIQWDVSSCLHCLSAFRPPGSFGYRQNEQGIWQLVSIAFRRFGPPAPLPAPQLLSLESVVSIAFRRFGPPARNPLCPRARRPPAVSIAFRRFGPPAQREGGETQDMSNTSPLPFGVSAPRLEMLDCRAFLA